MKASEVKKGDLWFMPQGGVLAVPSAKTEREAEDLVQDVLNAHPDIYCDWLDFKDTGEDES
tara:strand:- start:136 stop:318 length:183 start_codon:yes stop_codon:yes gene_type:complete